MNKRQATLTIDILIFTAFLLSACTGLVFRFASPGIRVEHFWVSLHNWVGMLMLAGIAAHLILHWKWIKAVATRFFKRTSRQARANFCLDCLLFGVFFLICLSGLIEWITSSSQWLFYTMHRNTGLAMVIYVCLHLALHWKWITSMIGGSFKRIAQHGSHLPTAS